MEKNDLTSFADLLKRLRVAAGLTQQELADRAGISVRSVSDLERVVNERPRRDTAQMLAAGLGLTDAERARFLEAARRRPRASPHPSSYPAPPAPSEPLLGRMAELRAITAALADPSVRLLTLTGPGGVGKTRLAAEAAHRLGNRFTDGVVFVRLEGLSDPALVIPTLAGAMQLMEAGGELSILDRLSAQLATHQPLVILDNLEHLLAATRDVAALLARTPQLRMLVTSRESLRIAGERVLPVAPLPRPDLATWQIDAGHLARGEDAPAMQLFVQRALARRPDLTVDQALPEGRANLATIAEICHRLDGLPLAIELAAAQAEVLSPVAILSLLRNAGLPMLTGGARDQPDRLQTMDAAIGWSYDLLSDYEQALFRALSVFAGGFTLTAADWVWSDSRSVRDPRVRGEGRHAITSSPSPNLVRMISSLARKNLVAQDMTPPDLTVPRFRMLEPLRLFALDRLHAAGEESTVRQRHAEHFAEAAEALDALTLGPDPEIWLEQQALDLDNFRAAQDWACANGEHALAVHVAAYIAQFWLLRGLHSEGRQRVASAMAVDVDAPPADRWFLRFWAAILAFDGGDVAAAGGHARDLLDIAEASGDQIGIGAGLTLLSQVVGAAPDGYEEAATLAHRAVDVLEPLGQDEWTASAWARLGIEYQNLGRLEEARDHLLHSLALRRRKRCEGCAAYSLVLLGAVYHDLGQPREAVDAFRECLTLAIKQGNQPLTVRALLGLADVAWRFGAGEEPARSALLLFGASEAVRLRHGFTWDATGAEIAARWQAPMRRAIGEDAVELLIGDGLVLSHTAVLEIAQELEVSPDSRFDKSNRETPSLLAALGSIE
ncbi:MAG: ATP-binding protein [Thermomicrobiales bacterium]